MGKKKRKKIIVSKDFYINGRYYRQGDLLKITEVHFDTSLNMNVYVIEMETEINEEDFEALKYQDFIEVV